MNAIKEMLRTVERQVAAMTPEQVKAMCDQGDDVIVLFENEEIRITRPRLPSDR